MLNPSIGKLLDNYESRYELDKDGKLVIYYKASQEGIDTINNYIKD